MPRRRSSPTTITPYHIEMVRQLSLKLNQGELATKLSISPASVRSIQSREGIPHFSRQTGKHSIRELEVMDEPMLRKIEEKLEGKARYQPQVSVIRALIAALRRERSACR